MFRETFPVARITNDLASLDVHVTNERQATSCALLVDFVPQQNTFTLNPLGHGDTIFKGLSLEFVPARAHNPEQFVVVRRQRASHPLPPGVPNRHK